MNRIFVIAFSILLLSSCKQSATETANDPAADSLKTEATAPAKDSATSTPAVQLSGKAAQVAGKWKASEFEAPSIKLSGELIDIRFDFKNDMTFEYSEDGKKESGTWKLNDKEDQVLLEYASAAKSSLNIKELKESKMILAGKEHGMYRTYTLERSK